jgi:transcriptional regulator with XRE-family HTH domain
LKEKLSDLCRDQKLTITPHKTNQEIAENTDLSVGTVAQFIRGDIKNPSVYTVGPICREVGVSIDEYFSIPREEPLSDSGASSTETEKLHVENAALREQLAQQQKSLRMHRLVTLILLSIVALCAFALVVDILSPTLGWFRA